MRADDPDVIEVEGPPALTHPAELVIAALSPIVTEARLKRITDVVDARTDDLVLVLDSIADPHNSSAVLRSADAFGVQNVHVVVGDHGFRASGGVSKGTQRWLDVTRYDDADICARRLAEEGYSLFVAAMDGERNVEELRDEARVAVVFGNEHRGASPRMRSLADGTFSIPMRGFVESLNISVAAAITMHVLAHERRPRLAEHRRRALLARFLMNSVKNAEQIIGEFRGNE